MNGDKLAETLEKTKNYEIIFTKHAELRLVKRQIEKQMVIEHIRNPVSLKLTEKLESEKTEEKYKLWFVPYKRTAYIYVIVLNHSRQKIIVKTVIKQKLMWQKKVERNAKQV